MSFGSPAGTLSRKQSAKVDVAKKYDNMGTPIEATSHGAELEQTDEMYSDSFTNLAVNLQSGTSIVTGHTYDEVNTDYAKETKTTLTLVTTVAVTTTA